MGGENLVQLPWNNSWSPWNWSGSDVNNALGINSGDPTNGDRAALRGNSAASQAYGDQLQQGYNKNTQLLNGTMGDIGQSQNYLADQMKGGHSVSMLQMQQGIGNAMAQQRAQAAAAGPQNSAMAQRSAANGMVGAGGQVMNQQAQAGLQERGQAGGALNQSQASLAQLRANARGQDVNAVNGAYGVAGNAYTQAMATPQKTAGNMWGGAAGGAASGIASMFSDERLKKNIKGGDADSKKTLGKLNGTDAKSLAGAGLGHVIKGDAVDTGRLSLANTAMLASLHKRLAKIEGR
jgi:hypothetical protein